MGDVTRWGLASALLAAAFMAGNVLGVEEPAPSPFPQPPSQPSAPTCPIYNYPDSTPFGKAPEAIWPDFPGCSIQIAESKESLVLSKFTAPAVWYSDDMRWIAGQATMMAPLLDVWTISCGCWSAIREMRLIFYKGEAGVRLMAIEKNWNQKGASGLDAVVASVNQRAGFNGTISDSATWHVMDFSTTSGSASVVRWNGKTRDFILAVDSAGAAFYGHSFSSIDIMKSEWAAYSAHIKEARRALQELQKAKAKAATSEL